MGLDDYSRVLYIVEGKMFVPFRDRTLAQRGCLFLFEWGKGYRNLVYPQHDPDGIWAADLPEGTLVEACWRHLEYRFIEPTLFPDVDYGDDS